MANYVCMYMKRRMSGFLDIERVFNRVENTQWFFKCELGSVLEIQATFTDGSKECSAFRVEVLAIGNMVEGESILFD